jgi:hypothetical protein
MAKKRAGPLTLAPLTVDEALSALLKTPPPPKGNLPPGFVAKGRVPPRGVPKGRPPQGGRVPPKDRARRGVPASEPNRGAVKSKKSEDFW